MPIAYLYTRVSHRKSAETGIGLDIQREKCTAYFDFIKGDNPGLQLGREYTDPAQSARKPLRLRPGGGEMNFALEPRDHIIFYKVDRAFRNMRDLTECVEIWEERGVTIHFTDLQLNLSTTIGKMMLYIVGALADAERNMASDRARSTVEYLEAHGRPTNRWAKYCHKIIGTTGKRRQVPLSPEAMAEFRAVPRKIVELRDNRSMGWTAISDHIEATLAAYEERRFRMMSSKDRKFKPDKVARLYRDETALQAKEAAVLAAKAEAEYEESTQALNERRGDDPGSLK